MRLEVSSVHLDESVNAVGACHFELTWHDRIFSNRSPSRSSLPWLGSSFLASWCGLHASNLVRLLSMLGLAIACANHLAFPLASYSSVATSALSSPRA